MAFTDQQIRDYAMQLQSKGAAPADIEKFVAEAKSERGDAPVSAPQSALSPPVNPNASLDARGYMDMAGTAVGTGMGTLVRPQGLATGARMGSAMLATEGGPIGSAINGGGEKAAQFIEGSNNPGAVGAATVLGFVPGGADVGVARGMIKNGLAGAAATNVNSIINSGQLASGADTAKAAGLGIATVPVGLAVGRVAQKVAGIKGTQLSPQDALMEARDKAFRAVRPYGAVVPPAEMSQGSSVIASAAGPADTVRDAVVKNQSMAQVMTHEDLGLGKVALPILPERFKAIRTEAQAPFIEMKKISSDAQAKLEEIRAASNVSDPHELAALHNDPATKKLMSPLVVQAGADVDALAQARIDENNAWEAVRNRQMTAADARTVSAKVTELQTRLEDAAEAAGKPELAKQLSAAKVLIAKTYAYQRATNPTTGLVDATTLGDELWSGAPLTGNAKKLADFGNAFRRVSKEAGNVLPSGQNNLNQNLVAMSATQGPAPGMLMAGKAAMMKPLRNYQLSSPVLGFTSRVQDRLAQPRYLPPDNDIGEKFSRFLLRAGGRSAPLDGNADQFLYNSGQ